MTALRIDKVDSRLNLDRYLESAISEVMDSMLGKVKKVWEEHTPKTSSPNKQYMDSLKAKVLKTSERHQVTIYSTEVPKPPSIGRKRVSNTSEENDWLHQVPQMSPNRSSVPTPPRVSQPMQWGRTSSVKSTSSWGHTSPVKKEPQMDMSSIYVLEELHSSIQDTFYDVLRNGTSHLLQ